MSVAAQDQSINTIAQPGSPRTITAENILTNLAIGVMAVTALILVAYLVIALNWRDKPFVGAMFTQSLTVEDIHPYSNQDWAALKIGIQSGDTIIGSEFEWAEDERQQRLADTLADLSVGDTLPLIIQPEYSNSRLPACGENTTNRCVKITLQQIPDIDFIMHFFPGYLTGVLIFAIGVLVLWRRRDSQSAQFFSMSAAALGIVLAGRMDISTSFNLVSIWVAGGVAFTALTLSFAIMFPYDLGIVRRVPNLRFAPLVGGLFVYALIIWLFEETLTESLLLIPLGLSLIAIIFLVGMMLWRRQYSGSPIIREQTTFVSLGAVVGFGPLLLWLIYFVISEGDIVNIATPVTQMTLLIYILSGAYAILQYRLMETDKIIPDFLVYNILGVMLITGYLLLALGLSLLSIDGLRTDSPIVVAITLGVVIFAFTPLRNYLREAVDSAMFRQRRNYQQRREDFSRKLSDAVNLEEILTATTDELNNTVSPSDVFLFRYDTKLRAYAPQPLPGQKRPNTDITFKSNSGLVKHLHDEQSVLYLEPGQPLPMTVVPDRSNLAVLGTPLIIRLQGRERLNGLLAVGPRRNGDPYSYEDLRFIESLADQVAVAVERAQFVDDLEHRVRIQDVLSQVSHALNFAIDFDTLLELIFAQTTRIIEADHFFIALRDNTSDELYYSFYNIGDERLYHVEGTRWKMERDLLSEVTRKQVAVRVDNYTQEQIKRGHPKPKGISDIYAWMGVPMLTDVAERGVLGVMAIGASDPGMQFSDEQLTLFRDIANIAASAIDKSQLFQKTEVRAAQLKALNDISGRLASELEDIDRLLQIITENAVSILGCEAGSLLLVNENTNDLVFRVVTGGGGQDLIGTRISRNSPSLVAEAVQRVETIIVNDPAHDKRWHGEVIDEHDEEGEVAEIMEEEPHENTFQSRAIITVPLVAQGTAVGALQVINKKDGSLFTDEDAALATTFAGQAAVAIQNARLFETQDKQLLERVQELEGMADIDHSLNQTIILDRLSDIIMNWALERTGATNGALLLVTPDKHHFELIASYGYPDDGSLFSKQVGEIVILPLSTGVLERTVNAKSPTMVTDVTADPHYEESLRGCVTQVVVPLISGSEVNGVILIETVEEGVLGLLEMSFLMRLADRAAVAIQNALLYAQLKVEQEQRSTFVGVIAHELGNAIAPVKGYSDFLVRGLTGELNPQQKQFMDVIVNNVAHMETLVKDMSDAEAKDLQIHLDKMDFREIVDESMANLQRNFEDKEQEVKLLIPDNLPEIWADRTRIKQIMINFLTNANKYTRDEGTVEVKAEVADNQWDEKGARRVLHIYVKDNGLGISQEDLERLFEKYFRSTNKEALDQKGTGLGLSLTRRLIEGHGGRIWVESELNVGTTFHFTIPLASEIVGAG